MCYKVESASTNELNFGLWTLCFLEGQSSQFHVPHNHVDRFANGKLQAWGRSQAGLAVFPQTEPSVPVLQRDGLNAAEEGKE